MSSREDIQQKIFTIIAEQLDVKIEEVALDKTFADDLGADSLGIVELVLAFEDAFGVKISDEEVDRIKSVGDAVNYIVNSKGNG